MGNMQQGPKKDSSIGECLGTLNLLELQGHMSHQSYKMN